MQGVFATLLRKRHMCAPGTTNRSTHYTSQGTYTTQMMPTFFFLPISIFSVSSFEAGGPHITLSGAYHQARLCAPWTALLRPYVHVIYTCVQLHSNLGSPLSCGNSEALNRSTRQFPLNLRLLPWYSHIDYTSQDHVCSMQSCGYVLRNSTLTVVCQSHCDTTVHTANMLKIAQKYGRTSRLPCTKT